MIEEIDICILYLHINTIDLLINCLVFIKVSKFQKLRKDNTKEGGGLLVLCKIFLCMKHNNSSLELGT